MPLTLSSIDRKIEQLKQIRQLAEDPEMLGLLQQLAADGKKANARQNTQLQLPTLAKREGRSGTGNTLVKAIEEHINRSPETGITIPQVAEALQASGWDFGATDAKKAVGTAVRRLAKAHKIAIIKASAGGIPSIYGRKGAREIA